MDYIELGPTPSDEEPAQINDADYDNKARDECIRFIDLIRQRCGIEPEGARLAIRWNKHEFGTYAEVVVKFDPMNRLATEYASHVDANLPSRWNEN